MNQAKLIKAEQIHLTLNGTEEMSEWIDKFFEKDRKTQMSWIPMASMDDKVIISLRVVSSRNPSSTIEPPIETLKLKTLLEFDLSVQFDFKLSWEKEDAPPLQVVNERPFLKKDICIHLLDRSILMFSGWFMKTMKGSIYKKDTIPDLDATILIESSANYNEELGMVQLDGFL